MKVTARIKSKIKAKAKIAGPTAATIKTDFSADKVNPEVGEQVQFTDLSTLSPTWWVWDFGDGKFSTAQNPTHTYNTAGTYTVTLHTGGTSDDAKDAGNVESKTDHITVSEDHPGHFFYNDGLTWINTDRSPVTVSSDRLSRIEDLGNLGHHLEQNTSAAQPSHGVETLNGKPVLKFQDDDFLESVLPAEDAKFLNDGTEYTVIMVVSVGDSADPDDLYILLATCAPTSMQIGCSIFWDDRSSQSANEQIVQLVGNANSGAIANRSPDGYLPPQTWGHVAFRSNPSSITSEGHWKDKSKFKNNIDNGSPNVFSPQHPLRVGQGDGSSFATMALAELILVKRQITSAEETKVHNYLTSEWNV